MAHYLPPSFMTIALSSFSESDRKAEDSLLYIRNCHSQHIHAALDLHRTQMQILLVRFCVAVHWLICVLWLGQDGKKMLWM